MSGTSYGDLATWFAVVVSACALLAAIVAGRYTAKAYHAQVKRDMTDNAERQEQERLRLREQAALVSTWIEHRSTDGDGGGPAVGALVRNASQTPVYQARLTIANIQNADQSVEHLIPVIPPDSHSRFYPFGGDEHVADNALALKSELAFTDSSGVRWSRDLQGRLVRLDDKVRLWADEVRTDVLTPFVERFSEPLGIRVEPRNMPFADIQPELSVAGRSRPGHDLTVPDLVVGVHDWIGNLVRDGILDPIPLSSQRRQAFNPVAVKAVAYQGLGYGIPYAIENVALFRNTELVPEAPATFEELVQVGLALRQQGRTSLVLSVPVGPEGDAYHFHPLFTAAGGPPLPTGADPGERDPSAPIDLGFSSPASIAAFHRIAELGERGQQVVGRTVSSGPRATLSEIGVFAKRLAPFLITGPWALAEINKSGVKYEITPIPAFAGSGPARPLVGVAAFFIPRKGSNRQLAHDFLLNYLTRTDLALALYRADVRPPALTLAIERLGADPVVTAFAAAATHGVPMPSWPEMTELFKLIGRAEAMVIAGEPVEPTVASLSREVADIMSRGNGLPRQRRASADHPA